MINAGLAVFILIPLIVDVFKVVAWYSCPSRIPPELDHEIVEPPMEDEDPRPAKRTLVYPVTLSVTPIGVVGHPYWSAVEAGGPPSSSPVNEERRHLRRCSGSPPTAPAPLGAPRAPVHERLVPQPGADGHVEPRDSISPPRRPLCVLLRLLSTTFMARGRPISQRDLPHRPLRGRRGA